MKLSPASLIGRSILGTALLCLSALPATASAVGLLGLYEAGSDDAHAAGRAALAKSLTSRGCSVRREGVVVGTQGAFEVPEVDRFLLLECEESLLATTSRRAALLAFADAVDDLVWIEGELVNSAGLASPPAPGRAYLIKLSRYNNRDPDARDDQVDAINRDARSRSHGFRNESVIAVSRAWGLVTPDEVTVLYYESPADAKRFRESNSDLMKRIGAFNEAHLIDAAYLNASAVRSP